MPSVGRMRKLLILALAMVVVGVLITFAVLQNHRHEVACAPARSAAAAADAALKADVATSQQQLPTPSSLADLYAAGDKIQSGQSQMMADTRAYFTAILADKSCFSSDTADEATTWFRANYPPDSDVNSYFYCWNSGSLQPHHIGHPIAGDHLCTYGELRSVGIYTR